MGNVYTALPAPAGGGNGNGAWTSVAAMGALKTVVLGGGVVATVTVQISNELVATEGAPVLSFTGDGQQSFSAAAQWARLVVSDYKQGTPDCSVGANDDGASFANLPVTAGNGSGAAVDVSGLGGDYKTVTVGGTFRGTVVIEVSQDNQQWGPAFVFTNGPLAQTALIAAQFMRVTRAGVPTIAPGTPIVNIGAVTDVTAGLGRLTADYYPENASTTRFIRSASGNDNNDGLTAATAWLTLKRGLEWFQIGNLGQSQILDITGSTFSVAEFLSMGGQAIGASNPSLDLTATGPNDYAYRAMYQIRADLQLVLPITITGTAVEATTGLRTVTVAEVLVVNAHRGQFIRGQGLAEGGVIVSNTAGTITYTNTSNAQVWTGQKGIYTYGATIEMGDDADLTYDVATDLVAYGDWFIGGVRFRSVANAKGTALRLNAVGGTITLQQCDIAGILVVDSPQPIFFEVCFIHDKIFSQNGGAVTYRNTLVRACTSMLCHGSGGAGLTELIQSVFDANAGPFGGGNVESCFSYYAERCQFINSTADGAEVSFGTSRMLNCLVASNVGDGVQVDKNALFIADNVQGTLNGGFGCRLQNGGKAQRLNASAVTGASGEVRVGAAGTFTWASAPQVDLGEFCRLYT